MGEPLNPLIRGLLKQLRKSYQIIPHFPNTGCVLYDIVYQKT